MERIFLRRKTFVAGLSQVETGEDYVASAQLMVMLVQEQETRYPFFNPARNTKGKPRIMVWLGPSQQLRDFERSKFNGRSCCAREEFAVNFSLLLRPRTPVPKCGSNQILHESAAMVRWGSLFWPSNLSKSKFHANSHNWASRPWRSINVIGQVR